MFREFLARLFRNRVSGVTTGQSMLSGRAYWEERVRKYGARSVLNIRHTEAEMEAVTQKQEEEIFPWLRKALRGDERVLLDLGCGPGRFTRGLASMINGRAIGVDPVPALLQMAPRAENVEYRSMTEGKIPLPDESADVIWTCLVLGGLNGNLLSETVAEMNRTLKKHGLIFLVENTSEQEDTEFWSFRSIEDYERLCSFCHLEHLHDYFDLGERISILAGRKR